MHHCRTTKPQLCQEGIKVFGLLYVRWITVKNKTPLAILLCDPLTDQAVCDLITHKVTRGNLRAQVLIQSTLAPAFPTKDIGHRDHWQLEGGLQLLRLCCLAGP